MRGAESLTHTLERTIVIGADRDVVFRFFTDNRRWASWWGPGSSIEPRAGGSVVIRYPDGTEAVGEILEIVPPERIVFTYGYTKGVPVPPGGSLVKIHLERHRDGTRLRLSHAFSDPSVRDEHIQGWRYQLSLFVNAVANELHSSSAALVDRWFDAWSESDSDRRAVLFTGVLTEDITMRDQFSAIDGVPDLLAHLTAVHRFMRGMTMRREGDVRHCQGTALADWVATMADGTERARGTNVFNLSPDLRIASVTGFWRAPRTPAEDGQQSS
jgi:uncharacterized protein YndB with AHSA1/START domain